MKHTEEIIREFEEKFPQFEKYPEAFQAAEVSRLDIIDFLRSALTRHEIAVLEEVNKTIPKATYGRKCNHREMCHWKECSECREYLVRHDILSLQEYLHTRIAELKKSVE